MAATETQKIPVSCNRDCGGGCPLLAHVRQGKIVKITDNPLKDPHLKGCIRGYQMPATVYSDRRLKVPLLRTGSRGSGQFKTIPWHEAFERITEKLGELRNQKDCNAVLAFQGSGACRGIVHNTGTLGKRFFALYGGFTGQLDTYSSAAAAFTEKYLFGTRTVGFDAPTLQHTKLIVLWGANISATRFGAQIESWIKTLKRNGIPVIVIDPRRSATVKKLASRWIPILPGTDTAMMAAVLFVMHKEGHIDRRFVENYTHGFDHLMSYVTGESDGTPKDPKWAEKICGVAAEQISAFAQTFADSRPAALLPGLSIQRTLGGEETYRFATALQAAAGNIGKPGGSAGAEFWARIPRPFFPSLPVPPTSAYPAINIYRWPDAVLEGKAGGYPSDIRVIYNIGTNYLNQGSDIKKNIRAFEKAGFVVTHDFFMTPTALYSDIILPVTTFLEREDVVLPADNYLFYSAKAIDPLHDSKNDYDILSELAEQLDFGSDFSLNRTSQEWLSRCFGASGIMDIGKFKSTGILKGKDQSRVALSDFIANPLRNPLPTPSGKIEIRSEDFASTGGTAVPQCRITRPDESFPLRLVTPHASCRVNSQNSNLNWTLPFQLDLLEMNRQDGIERGLQTGDRVLVFSPIGEMRIKVKLSEDILQGTVSLHQGSWTKRDGSQIENGASANILTSTVPTRPSNGSRTHSVFVQVEKEKKLLSKKNGTRLKAQGTR